MTNPNYALDVIYASLRLGVDPAPDAEALAKITSNAKSYAYIDRARLDLVLRIAAYFKARARFATLDTAFADLRKIYHQKAMALHPDTNKGDKDSEEALKSINDAYHLVDAMYKEASQFFNQPAPERESIAADARAAIEQETPEVESVDLPDDPRAAWFQSTRKQTDRASRKQTTTPNGAASSGRSRADAPTAATARQDGDIRYMAASIPRYIRTARLAHLPMNAIIGSYIKGTGPGALTYDVIMLAEKEFARAKTYLGAAATTGPDLQTQRLTPTYIPQDTQSFTAAAGSPDPHSAAREYFLGLFPCHENRT